MTHICISKLTITGSDNGLSPGRRQAIIWANAAILLIGPLGTKLSEILVEIYKFLFKKMHLKISSGNCWPFCLRLHALYHRFWNVLCFSLWLWPLPWRAVFCLVAHNQTSWLLSRWESIMASCHQSCLKRQGSRSSLLSAETYIAHLTETPDIHTNTGRCVGGQLGGCRWPGARASVTNEESPHQ